MAGNDPHLLRRQFSFNNVEVSAAYATGANAQENVTQPQAGIGNINDLKRTL
jgi:hypothetical protein